MFFTTFPLRLLLLIAITALGAWGIQILDFLSFSALAEYRSLYTLLIIDLAAATFLLLLCKKIYIFLFTLQLIAGLFIGNYTLTLGSLPSLTALVHGASAVQSMSLTSFVHYMHWPIALFCVGVFLAQLALASALPTVWSKARRWALGLALLLCLGLHAVITIQSPLSLLSMQHELAEVP
ncbi:MAG: hypothetical protein PHN64_10220 [Desulfovibrionaceae bacterium]|nr:hypothetical protein [Desulfovibrionaceae bacterium]